MEAQVNSVNGPKLVPVKKKKLTLQTVYSQRYLLLMSVPFMIWLAIFKYYPLWGWKMAFQDNSSGITQWVGLANFKEFFNDSMFYDVLRNTLAMSGLQLLVGFTIPIAFAIFLNEMAHVKYKKAIQTISYLPHFISWVIAASIITQFLSIDGGVVNDVLVKLHIVKEPIAFLSKPTWFWGIVTISDVWKETGWNAIIFIAAILGIDQSLYEAAEVDGAGRFRKIWHITLPGIKATIIVILIMSIGQILNTGMDKQYQLQNNIVKEYSEVLDIYTLDYGISAGRFNYGTAVGMFKSVISVILVLGANTLSKKMGEGSIY